MKSPLLPETFYHIYNHANGDENIFREDKNYDYFLSKYVQYIQPIVDTYAYCLMPNHFHLMIRVKATLELQSIFAKVKDHQGFETLDGLAISKLLSRQFSHFFNSYAQAFNKLYNRKGSLFRSNFKRKAIEDENYFTALIQYIHFNPVHHKFTNNPFSWKHSSIHALISSDPSHIARSEVLEWFGGREAFIKFHSEPHDRSLQSKHFD